MQLPAAARLISISLGAFALGVLLTGNRVSAQPAVLPTGTKVVLAVDGIKVVRNLPVLLAQNLGYFKAEGLDVSFMETSADAKVDAMLVDGRVAGMVAYYHHTIVAQAEGRACEAVITMAVTPGYELLVANQLKGSVGSPADLKGKRIIAGGPHSAKSTVANWLVLHAGYQLADYTRLAPTDKMKIAESLRKGEADFVIAPEPDATFYRTQGVASLFADIYSVAGTRQSLGSIFPSTVLYMSTPYAQANPDLAQHLVNAFARTLKFINTHNPAEITALVPEMMTGENQEPGVMEQGVKMFATDGLMPAEAAKMETMVLSALFPEYAKVSVADTYTNEFVSRTLGK
jgi:NitT/TauT family transport system substrate-binding protein